MTIQFTLLPSQLCDCLGKNASMGAFIGHVELSLRSVNRDLGSSRDGGLETSKGLNHKIISIRITRSYEMKVCEIIAIIIIGS